MSKSSNSLVIVLGLLLNSSKSPERFCVTEEDPKRKDGTYEIPLPVLKNDKAIEPFLHRLNELIQLANSLGSEIEIRDWEVIPGHSITLMNAVYKILGNCAYDVSVRTSAGKQVAGKREIDTFNNMTNEASMPIVTQADQHLELAEYIENSWEEEATKKLTGSVIAKIRNFYASENVHSMRALLKLKTMNGAHLKARDIAAALNEDEHTTVSGSLFMEDNIGKIYRELLARLNEIMPKDTVIDESRSEHQKWMEGLGVDFTLNFTDQLGVAISPMEENEKGGHPPMPVRIERKLLRAEGAELATLLNIRRMGSLVPGKQLMLLIMDAGRTLKYTKTISTDDLLEHGHVTIDLYEDAQLEPKFYSCSLIDTENIKYQGIAHHKSTVAYRPVFEFIHLGVDLYVDPEQAFTFYRMNSGECNVREIGKKPLGFQ